MKQQLNVGIIGFGYMGKMHAMCYDNIKFYYNTGIEVNLYAAVTSKKQEELPVRFEKLYKTYDELLEDDKVDIIDICVPNHLHKDVLIKAIKKKKYIYCEKPLTLDLASSKEVIEVLHKIHYDRINRVVFEYRFVPAILRAKQLIVTGAIGKLINFNFKYYGCEFLDPTRCISWQSTKELSGGGVLYAMGTHSIDLIRYLIGEISEVSAQKKTHFKKRPKKGNPDMQVSVEIEDIMNVQMNCENDVIGNLFLSQVAAGSGIDFNFEIYGEDGAIKFSHDNPNVIYYYNNKTDKAPYGGFGGYTAIETTQKYGGEAVFPPPRVTISWSRYHIASIYDFLHAIETGEKTHPNLEDGYMVQQITEAIYKSAENRTIEQVH